MPLTQPDKNGGITDRSGEHICLLHYCFYLTLPFRKRKQLFPHNFTSWVKCRFILNLTFLRSQDTTNFLAFYFTWINTSQHRQNLRWCMSSIVDGFEIWHLKPCFIILREAEEEESTHGNRSVDRLFNSYIRSRFGSARDLCANHSIHFYWVLQFMCTATPISVGMKYLSRICKRIAIHLIFLSIQVKCR